MESVTFKINLNNLVNKPDIRLGVISDTHNQLNEGIVGALKDCDAIVHAGDIGDASVLKNLQAYSPHIFPVRGNNDMEDRWPNEDLPELANIPEHCELHFQDQIIGLIHGHQYDHVRKRHDKLRGHFPNADIIIYGHSHRLVCDQEHKPWVINPGAGGYTRNFGGASCLVMEYKLNTWTIEQHRLEPN